MIKFKLYSRYDSTDALKSASDSSILNKEERGKLGKGTRTALLAGAGGVLGSASAVGGKFKKFAGGTKGALIGAGVGLGLSALESANKTRRENNFYNQRLREAKRAAKRRESIDWNNRIQGRSYYE